MAKVHMVPVRLTTFDNLAGGESLIVPMKFPYSCCTRGHSPELRRLVQHLRTNNTAVVMEVTKRQRTETFTIWNTDDWREAFSMFGDLEDPNDAEGPNTGEGALLNLWANFPS